MGLKLKRKVLRYISRFNPNGTKWENLRSLTAIRLYAGDVPDRHEYEGWIGLSLYQTNRNHIRHNLYLPFPIQDETVDAFQAEDVFEHLQYDKIVSILDEIYRVLKINGYLRLSLPDYRCDVNYDRSIKDLEGRVIFDPGGGYRSRTKLLKLKVYKRIYPILYTNIMRHISGSGHYWFPTIESVRRLIEKSKFAAGGTVNFLHYYDDDGIAITKPIDYSKGYISRTPDHDKSVQNHYRPLSLVVDIIKKA
jgi:SAM-dependent methyltransferase